MKAKSCTNFGNIISVNFSDEFFSFLLGEKATGPGEKSMDLPWVFIWLPSKDAHTTEVALDCVLWGTSISLVCMIRYNDTKCQIILKCRAGFTKGPAHP